MSLRFSDELGIMREWHDVAPSLVDELDDGSADSLSALGLLSMHWSGYVREAAVRHLALRLEPLAIAFLLLRANDWVPQVRQRAKKALMAVAAGEHGERLGSVLPLVTRLSGGRRENHDLLVRAIDAVFKGPRGIPALRTAT
jgi:HEAT repeat protein